MAFKPCTHYFIEEKIAAVRAYEGCTLKDLPVEDKESARGYLEQEFRFKYNDKSDTFIPPVSFKSLYIQFKKSLIESDVKY